MSRNKGFTLVELMVVVVIIGILAAVALPNYTTFQTKARQAEAKTALGAAYSTEKSFFYENNTYTACASAIGVIPDPATKNLYAVGFAGGNAAATGCGAGTATAGCNFTAYDPVVGTGVSGATCVAGASAGVHGFNAAAFYASGGASAVLASVQIGGFGSIGLVDNNSFNFGAAGQISPTNTQIDRWSINEAKSLANNAPGL